MGNAWVDTVKAVRAGRPQRTGTTVASGRVDGFEKIFTRAPVTGE
ncbi:hypothetical protein [Salinigranum salinum]|nr:hypothetical protein [Salinigranum salinum]